jgi:hypothetical protein
MLRTPSPRPPRMPSTGASGSLIDSMLAKATDRFNERARHHITALKNALDLHDFATLKDEAASLGRAAGAAGASEVRGFAFALAAAIAVHMDARLHAEDDEDDERDPPAKVGELLHAIEIQLDRFVGEMAANAAARHPTANRFSLMTAGISQRDTNVDAALRRKVESWNSKVYQARVAKAYEQEVPATATATSFRLSQASSPTHCSSEARAMASSRPPHPRRSSSGAPDRALQAARTGTDGGTAAGAQAHCGDELRAQRASAHPIHDPEGGRRARSGGGARTTAQSPEEHQHQSRRSATTHQSRDDPSATLPAAPATRWGALTGCVCASHRCDWWRGS